MKYKIIISLLALILFLCINVNADETSYYSPSNDGANFGEWGAPENGYSQDDTYSTGYLSDRQNEQDYYDFSIDLGEGCPVIDGILVEFDAYGSTSGKYYNVSLTWNNGASYTTEKQSSQLPTSDTDTYIQLGGSTDTWGRTWDISEFTSHGGQDFQIYFRTIGTAGFWYLDHVRVKIYYTSEEPNMPNCVRTILDTTPYCNHTDFIFTKGIGADTTLFKWSTEGYPTFTTGILLYNGSNNNFEVAFDYCFAYYVCAWSWNNTYCLYSQEYDTIFISPCNPTINTIYNNTENISGSIETKYSCRFGWDIWVNMTGNKTICDNTSLTLYENIGYALGTHESLYNPITGWKVWANYSSYIILFENIENVTGTHEYQYNPYMGGTWFVWANYTGNCSGIGSCVLKHLYYSDDNISINITYYGCNNTNTSNYNINENNWLNLASTLLFDEGQVFLVILLSLWVYFISKYFDTLNKIFAYSQLALVFPLTIILGIISLTYVFGYILVLFLPIISIYIFYYCIMYERKLNRRK